MTTDPAESAPDVARLVMSAVLVLGLLVTVSWIAVVGYGVVELVEWTL
jgi:hypothetical protein